MLTTLIVGVICFFVGTVIGFCTYRDMLHFVMKHPARVHLPEEEHQETKPIRIIDDLRKSRLGHDL